MPFRFILRWSWQYFGIVLDDNDLFPVTLVNEFQSGSQRNKRLEGDEKLRLLVMSKTIESGLGLTRIGSIIEGITVPAAIQTYKRHALWVLPQQ